MTSPTTTATTPTTEIEEPPMTTTEVPLPPAAEATTATTTGSRPASRRRAVAAALRGEWIKAATVRTNKVLLATSAIVGLLISWATATFGSDDAQTVADVYLYPTLLTAVLAAVAGILVLTSEVQHGTLAGALTAHPSRWPVVAAKTVFVAGVGLLLGAVGMATGILGALVAGLEVGDTSGMVTTVLWGLLYTAGSALLGLGVGMVVRHSAGAVSGLLVWWLVVEGLVVQFAPAEVARFVPFDTGFRTLGVESDLDVPEVAAAGLSNLAHASIFWGYVIAALVLGTALLVRRDVD